MTELTETFKDNLTTCPKCGTTIPVNIRACWHCSEILDSGLKRLMEMKKNEA